MFIFRFKLPLFQFAHLKWAQTDAACTGLFSLSLFIKWIRRGLESCTNYLPPTCLLVLWLNQIFRLPTVNYLATVAVLKDVAAFAGGRRQKATLQQKPSQLFYTNLPQIVGIIEKYRLRMYFSQFVLNLRSLCCINHEALTSYSP